MINWTGIITWVLARLDEPSTYTGIAALLAAGGIQLDPHVASSAVPAAMALAGFLGVVLSEKKGS